MNAFNEIVPCVILAGGKGRRMGGKEKALVNLLDRPLISYMLEKISGKVAPIALNVNTNLKEFKKFGYKMLEDPIKGHLGPLVGILASLNWAKNLDQKWVLTLPCDTPFLPKNLIEALIDAKNKNPNIDLVVVKSGGFRHPVIALWKTSNNIKLENAIEDGIRKIDIFTSQLKIKHVNFDNLIRSKFDPFTNLNSPKDLIIAMQVLGKLPPVIGISGWSGSGKTTLCTKLIENLAKIGFNVGTLKHAHHKFDIDKPGKDSDNLRKAGAQPIVISSKEKFAIIKENNNGKEKSLHEILEIFAKDPFSKCDVIIVEGYKKDDIPKIEVFRHEIGKPFLHKGDATIFAIASEEKLFTDIPSFDFNNINSITQFLINKFEITKTHK